MSEYIVRISGVDKSFGNKRVIEGCSLDIEEGEFITILGPSGCGKTTLLRIVAGFERNDCGWVEIAGEVMGDTPPYKRPVNMVFQRYSLFPHLNVYENIAFGLRLKRMSEDRICKKVRAALDLVRLPGFENRNVTTLSGGESQRVALTRALVNEPRVLLLDEPLAALDLKIRKAMQEELKRIHAELANTFLYVTHDQEEAMVMSDRIVVMSAGRIKQIGTPFDIYYEPSCLFSGQFVGESNILEGEIVELGDETVCVDVQDALVWGRPQQSVRMNESVSMLIRPEMIVTHKVGSGVMRENKLKGTLTDVTLIGGLVRYQITTDNGLTIRASEHAEDPDQLLQKGQQVTACWFVRDTLVFIE